MCIVTTWQRVNGGVYLIYIKGGKIMKKIISVLLSFLMLTGCGGTGEYNRCIKHLKGHMKDPSSLVVESATGYKDEEGYVAFKVYYNGKNSFGAYAGTSSIYICIRPSGEVQCSHCEILDGDSQFYYTITQISGEQIYSK